MMCVVTQNGIRMNDGSFIPYDTSIADIHPKHIDELSKNVSSVWENFLIHRQIKEMKNEILPLLQSVATHTTGCPINRTAVEAIVLDKMKSVGKQGWVKTLDIIKNITLIATGILVVLKILERI